MAIDDRTFNNADPNRVPWESRNEERRQIKPRPLCLFFPRFGYLPTDTHEILRGFVPPPEAFAVPALDAPPATHTLLEHVWSDRMRQRHEWEEPVRVREMQAAAESDLRSVSWLIEAGNVSVTDKKLVPTEAARHTVAAVHSFTVRLRASNRQHTRRDDRNDTNVSHRRLCVARRRSTFQSRSIGLSCGLELDNRLSSSGGCSANAARTGLPECRGHCRSIRPFAGAGPPVVSGPHGTTLS